MSENKAPVKKFRCGSIVASIWENELKDKRVLLSVTLQKTYKDGDEWKESKSYTVNDLPKVKNILEKSFDYIMAFNKDEK